MLILYINGADRTQDYERNTLTIKEALNRRSNNASFSILSGTKPAGNQICKIYQGAIVTGVSGADITFSDSYELNYNTFRAGQTLFIRIGETDQFKGVVDSYNEATRTVTLTATPSVTINPGDKVGELIFGGVISRVTDSNLHSLTNLVWDVTVSGYERLFDKKLVSDTWAEVDSRYIINDYVNTTVNYNRTFDNLSYEDNTAIQAVWNEASDGNNPTVDDADYLEAVSSGVFGWTNSSGTATWAATVSGRDISLFTGVASGAPTKGSLMLWLKSSSVSSITSVKVRIGSSATDYAEVTLTLRSTTDWQYLNADLDTASITGTPDWTNTDYLQIRITETATGSVKLNGLRVNAINSFTLFNIKPTTTLETYRSPQVRPSQIIDTLSKAFEFIWYIDYEQDVHFKDKEIQTCFYDVNDNSDNFFDLQSEVDQSQLGNRIIIEGGQKTSDSIYKQAVQGNNAVREWIMKSKFKNLAIYLDNNTSTDTMEGGTNTTTVVATAHGLSNGDWIVNRTRGAARQIVYVDPNTFTIEAIAGQTDGDTFSKFATQVTVGVEGINDESLFDYMSNFNEKSIRASSQTDTLTDTDYLLFVYNEVLQISIQYTDSPTVNALKAIGLGDGVFDLDKITDSNITDTVTAITLAQAKTAEFANPVITGSFVTNFHGFKVGDLLTVNETERALAGDYVIQKINKKQRQGEFGDHFDYNIEFGTTLYGVIEFYQKLLQQNNNIEVDPDAIVETFVTTQEALELTETNTIYEYAGTWKYEPSVGQPLPSRYNLCSYS